MTDKKENFKEFDDSLEEISLTGSEEHESLVPPSGESYDKFMQQSNDAGSASYLIHMLMSNFDDEKKAQAEDLIKKTLSPGDLISHVLRKSKSDPEVAKAFRREIEKRRAKLSSSTSE